MRSLPSQGPLQIKLLGVSPLSLSSLLSLFLCPHPVFHATSLLLGAPILGHGLSLSVPPIYTKMFDPICLTNLGDLMSPTTFGLGMCEITSLMSPVYIYRFGFVYYCINVRHLLKTFTVSQCLLFAVCILLNSCPRPFEIDHHPDDHFCQLCGLSCLHPLP